MSFARTKRKRNGLVLSFARTKRKRPGYSTFLEEQSEAKGISPRLSKWKVKRIGVFRKFAKTKQNEVKTFKIVQDRSKTKLFISYCEEEEKGKKTKLRFFWSEAKKNEYNRSSTIEDLPLLNRTIFRQHKFKNLCSVNTLHHNHDNRILLQYEPVTYICEKTKD